MRLRKREEGNTPDADRKNRGEVFDPQTKKQVSDPQTKKQVSDPQTKSLLVPQRTA